MITYLQKNFNKIKKFIFVGIITFCLNNSLLWFFINIYQIQYQISFTFSYILTILFHFLIHKYITFLDIETNKIPLNINKYIIMLIINFIISFSIVSIIVEIFYMSPYAGSLISVMFTALSSFTIMNHFVFKFKEDRL